MEKINNITDIIKNTIYDGNEARLKELIERHMYPTICEIEPINESNLLITLENDEKYNLKIEKVK